MREVVIVSGMRTPIGDFLGSLKELSAVELGIIVLKAALNKAGIEPSQIEEVVAGHANQAGCKPNTARQVALGSGCSVETVAVTVNQQCVSSLRATEILAQEIILGKVEVGAAVGPESMSNIPYLLPGARNGYRMGSAQVVDAMFNDGLIDAFNNYHMGVTAENLAKMYKISREEQDELALLSHQRACQANKELGIKPLARIVATASTAVDPKIMGIGVVPAVKRALHFANLTLKDIGYWEINEAFAAQFLAVNRELNLDMDQVNANGSGISLGHPVSCTGARIVVTLLHEMQRRGVRFGCASLCGGGGPATAIILEQYLD
ncbi:hypothetical protein JCM17380_38400 [Desulfosporosinus burensis]